MTTSYTQIFAAVLAAIFLNACESAPTSAKPPKAPDSGNIQNPDNGINNPDQTPDGNKPDGPSTNPDNNGTDNGNSGNGNNPSGPGNTPPDPFAGNKSSDWSNGELAQLSTRNVLTPRGEQLPLAKLQNQKKYLVLGFFDSNCKHCSYKAELLTHQDTLPVIQTSSSCSFAAVSRGGTQSWQQYTAFHNNFLVTDAVTNDQGLELLLFPDGMKYPATVVIDDKGNVIQRYEQDHGPQSLLAFCNPEK